MRENGESGVARLASTVRFELSGLGRISKAEILRVIRDSFDQRRWGRGGQRAGDVVQRARATDIADAVLYGQRRHGIGIGWQLRGANRGKGVGTGHVVDM